MIYMYQGALLCGQCGLNQREELDGAGRRPKDIRDENSWDSDEYPKGPYNEDTQESDFPHSCDNCHVLLENPLTDFGRKDLCLTIAIALYEGAITDKKKELLKTWISHYDISLDDLIDARSE